MSLCINHFTFSILPIRQIFEYSRTNRGFDSTNLWRRMIRLFHDSTSNIRIFGFDRIKIDITEYDEDVLEEPTTPDQSIKPSNPKFSSSTQESQGEPSTKKLLDDSLGDTIFALRGGVSYLNWLSSRIRMHLFQRYVKQCPFSNGKRCGQYEIHPRMRNSKCYYHLLSISSQIWLTSRAVLANMCSRTVLASLEQ